MACSRRLWSIIMYHFTITYIAKVRRRFPVLLPRLFPSLPWPPSLPRPFTTSLKFLSKNSTRMLRSCPHHASNAFRSHYNRSTQQSPVILDLCLRKTRAGKSRDYRDVIVLEKLRFQNVFRPHGNEKPMFWNFLRFEVRFRNGLVRTVGLTVTRNKPPLSISSSVVWMG